MTAKFNFLKKRAVASKAAADLRQRYPARSHAWIEAQAKRIAGVDEITTELQAPRRSPPYSQARGDHD